MRMFPVQSTLAGLMCVGLLGVGACNRDESRTRMVEQNPPASPSASNPGTTGTTGTTGTPGSNPGSPTPGTTSPTTPSPGTPGSEAMGRAETPPAPTGLTAPETIVAAELPLAQKALNDIRKVNALEIEVGKLAQERGSSEEVKSFGKELVEDHQNADKKLVEFAMKNNVVLTGSTGAAGSERPTGLPSERDRPTGTGTAAAVDGNPPPVALDAKGKKEVAQLRAARGARFDRAFTNAMVKGHTEAVELIKSSKDKVNHGEFDSLLNDIQSSVEKHLEHAKQLQATSGGRAAAPAEERTMQGRRPPPPSPSQVPDPTMDPGRVPDPTRPDPARPEPTRLPDPSGIPDPSRAPGPTDPTSPSPTPSPTP